MNNLNNEMNSKVISNIGKKLYVQLYLRLARQLSERVMNEHVLPLYLQNVRQLTTPVDNLVYQHQ